MKQFKTPLKLTGKLVSLPSYVSNTQDETPATDFLEEYIKTNLPQMKVEQQYLKDSPRYNLIIRGKDTPKLFVLGHIDTVQPKEGWTTDPLVPVVKQDRLYGLGAADMKGSLAAFLWALVQEQRNLTLDNLMLLIYVDEEYDFKGMKRFLEDDGITKLSPDITLSLDGDLEVATGCRGVIEIKLAVKGKSGHASDPGNGINVVSETVAALQAVSRELSAFNDPALGSATTNIAYLRGGATRQDKNGKTTWLQEGNIIPDTAEVIFEVRTPTREVNAEFVSSLIKRCLKERGLTLLQATVRHNISPWPVQYDEQSLKLLRECYAEAEVSFQLSDCKLKGYIDAQMVVEKMPVPTFIIGTGGENKHGANESVSLEDIEQAVRVYSTILQKLLRAPLRDTSKT